LNRKAVGRVLRRYPLTARLLTEYRIQQLVRSEASADLARCMQLVVPGSVAIDVGASVGNYALAMSKAVGRDGRVIALEPNPAVFSELVASTWASRVSPLNLAASSRPGWAKMTVPVDQDGCQQEPLATLEPRDEDQCRTFEVRCARLDDLVGGSRPVSLIKVDVEGHEADVLEGASELLERHRPALVVEIEERHLVGRSVADVAQWIMSKGYACHGIKGRQLIPWQDLDIGRDQLQWLSGHGGKALQGSRVDYVNNFLFTATS
jgi:FkbM family methyltransferase